MRPRRFLPREAFDLPTDSRGALGRGEDRLLAATRRFRLREPVGARRSNRPDDAATVERLLNRVGPPPFGTGREPTGLFSVPLRDSIRRFQRGNDLRDDGIVNPDGETFDALTREIGFDDEDAVGRSVDTTDPDGNTQRGLRCRQVADDLANNVVLLRRREQQVEQNRRDFEQALERVRQAAAAKAKQPAEIAAAVASILSSLARRDPLSAAIEAGALAFRLIDTETGLNVESRTLNQAADALRDALERLEDLNREIAELKAERDRLGCPGS